MYGMSLPQATWYGAMAGYLGMWMAMMVPMMLPVLIPMLWWYRRSVRGASGIQLHGLTALVGLGYFVIWTSLGVVAWAGSAGLRALEARWVTVDWWPPVASGVVLLGAGVVQFTAWKGRQLVRCREGADCGCPTTPDTLGAWSHGLRMGIRCSLCCGNLMLALLAIGTMHLVAMGVIALAISAERLAPAPLIAARVAGVAMVVVGVLTIARV